MCTTLRLLIVFEPVQCGWVELDFMNLVIQDEVSILNKAKPVVHQTNYGAPHTRLSNGEDV